MNHKPLLRDLPGFSESIENNIPLQQQIADALSEIRVENNYESITDDCINDIVESLDFVKFSINDDGEVIIKNKRELAVAIFKNMLPLLEEQEDFIVQNTEEVSLSICKEITEFVNENYTQK